MDIDKRERKRYCIIYGCNSNSLKDKDIKFFRFPNRDSKEYTKWLSRCKTSYNRIMSLSKPLVCSLHFPPEDIGKQRLHRDTYPSLNLSAPPEYEFEEDLKSKMNFMERVTREWILRSRCYQNISRKTVSKVSRDVRKLLNIPRNVPNPQWMREIEYLPILPDANGTILVARNYCRSHVEEIIRDLRNLGDQERSGEQKPVDTIFTINFADMPIMNETQPDVDEDYEMPRYEEVREAKIKNLENTGDHIFDLNDQCIIEDSMNENLYLHGQAENNAMGKSIDSYEDALEYLKPLQYFVKQGKDYLTAIALVAQLQTIFKGRIGQEGDSRLFKQTLY